MCVGQLSAVFETARHLLYSTEASYFSVACCSQYHHSIHVEDTASHQGVWVLTRISITTVLVQELITAKHNVTVPQLGEIEQQHNVKVCARSWVSS